MGASTACHFREWLSTLIFLHIAFGLFQTPTASDGKMELMRDAMAISPLVGKYSWKLRIGRKITEDTEKLFKKESIFYLRRWYL